MGSVHMAISSDLAARIAQRIQHYVSPSEHSKEAAAVALSMRALPLYLEAGGIFAITLTGEIIIIPTDEPHNIRTEPEERIRNIVLFQGSKTYPELSDLAPSKPVSAQVCPACNGSGNAPTPDGVPSDNFVCYCGGLGWIP